MTVRRVHRYRGVLAGAVLLGAVGAVVTSDWLIALAAVPLAFVAVEELTAPSTSEIAVERTCSTTRPEPGQRVTVSLTVRNVGDSPLSDVRIHDGVPAGLSVVDGTTRAATALAPGDSETVEYAVRANRGDHAFASPSIRLRGIVGGTLLDHHLDVAGDDSLVARRFFEHAPSAEETATMVGVVPTDRGGSGVEFHTTREYRSGDPMNRIDWRRLARNGELSTVNYREHEGASVTVLADCRLASSGSGPGATLPADVRQSLLDRTGYAADRTVHALSGTGHDVGLAAVGNGFVPWVKPGATDAPARARAAIRAVEGSADWEGPTLLVGGGGGGDRPETGDDGATGPADAATGSASTEGVPSPRGDETGDAGDTGDASGATGQSAPRDGGEDAEAGDRPDQDDADVVAPDGGTATIPGAGTAEESDGDGPGLGAADTAPLGEADAERLADRLAESLPAGGVAVLVSPLLDDVPVELATRLAARGHALTVLTPALGESKHPDVRIDSLARRTRIEQLRTEGAPVIDWDDAESLPVAVARAEVRRQ